jgi:uncharacterized protein with ATP-grasp and redox domains
MPTSLTRPAPIMTNDSNAFGLYSMKVRVPKIIEEVITLNPDYPAPMRDALYALARDIESDAPIPMILLPAPDYAEWAAEYAPHAGETWLNTVWFFAEIFMYRHIIQAVRWWETGRDPFTAKKVEEQNNSAVWEFLHKAIDDQKHDDLSKLLQYALWGNRIDLSYNVGSKHGSNWTNEDLVADDTAAVVDYLKTQRGTIHIVADNAGTELVADLVLIDTLISQHADQVMYHVKLHPVFVSDTTVPDVHTYFRLLDEHGGEAQQLSKRLQQAFVDGRLRIQPDQYWNGTRWLWELPERLSALFKSAALVIFKGDANYRRIVGDAIWPSTTPFADVVDYFPAPILALRTLKSDALCGLPAGLAEQLDAADKDWRINGRRGVIQFARNR